MITQLDLIEEIAAYLQNLKVNDAIYEYPKVISIGELIEYIVFDVFDKKYKSLTHNVQKIYKIAQNISELEDLDFENINKQLLRTAEKFGTKKEGPHQSLFLT